MPELKVRHPAKYSDVLLPIFAEMLDGFNLVLDPFGGTGKLRKVRPDAIILEIEPEWAKQGCSIIGDALHLPFASGEFDAICTSPCYGNRMADHHNARDGSRRNTYTHAIGRKLHSHNAGQIQWGEAYREFHMRVWKECQRVLRAGGLFVLNVSDHIRDGKTIPVTAWHAGALSALGFMSVESRLVETPRLKNGENYDRRVPYESVLVFHARA